MHITLETDYAIRIMAFLIKENKRVDAKMISAETDVTLRFALKILRKLVAAELVRSFKGLRGGYEYAREKPSDVSLYEIVEIIEGDCLISRCLDSEIGCNRGCEASCKARKSFAKISKNMMKQLSAVTFDTLID